MTRNRIRQWFYDRFDVEKLSGAVKHQLQKPLPKHVSWFHTLGSLSLFLFASQVFTGMLLLVYYRPTVQEAFESVKFITTTPHMGWFYRQIHAWGANLMVVVVFFHMLRTYVTGSYKKPRELQWVIGVMLFIFTLIFGFTGYLLPWNQQAYWATTVGTEVAGAIPVLGEWIKTLLRGGATISGETLSRFFVIHVIVLPWTVFFLIMAHLFLVRIQGVATMNPVDREEKVKTGQGIPFFPHHVLKEGIVFFILFGVMISLAVLMPFELGEKANPLETPHGIKPDWYFLPFYQVLKYFPELLGIFIVILGPILLFLWPFWDRGRERHPFKRPLAMSFGALVLLSLLILGLLGYLSETRRTLLGRTFEFDIYGIPHRTMADRGSSE